MLGNFYTKSEIEFKNQFGRPFMKGPAQFGLKQYNTYWDGAYTVSINN